MTGEAIETVVSAAAGGALGVAATLTGGWLNRRRHCRDELDDTVPATAILAAPPRGASASRDRDMTNRFAQESATRYGAAALTPLVAHRLEVLEALNQRVAATDHGPSRHRRLHWWRPRWLRRSL